MRLLWCYSSTLAVVRLIAGIPSGDFAKKLGDQEIAHKKLFHEALLNQLAASRLSNETSSNATTQSDTSVIDDLNALVSTANMSSQVDATTGLAIYTDGTLPISPAPSASCAAALLATIDCNSTIPLMGVSTTLLEKDLGTLCTSTCAASLASYRAKVVSACPGYSMILDTATNATPYTVQCLKDPTSENYCSTVIAGYNASGGIPSLPTNELCSYCVIATLNATLLNSVSFSVAVENLYNYVAEQCSLDLFNPASVTSPIVTAGTPSGVTIENNATCADIAAAANITTVQLQLYNPSLGSTCQFISQQVGNLICIGPHGGFPDATVTSAPIAPSGTATTLAAVPTPTAPGSTAACGEWAMAVAGDFCGTFALKYSVTLADLYTMNPEINANCTNLLAGSYYCVEPYPPFSSVTTTAIATSGTNYSAFSTFSYSFPPYTSTVSLETLTPAGVPAPTNVAPGTRTAACGYYYNIAEGDTLASIANISDNTEADLISWNAQLATAVPAVGDAVCVIFPIGNYTLIPETPPENVSPFATTECADYYTTVANDSCDTIAAAQDITSEQFLALNPGLTCAGLLAGAAYCDFPLTPILNTGPPSNLAAGSLKNCTTYYTIASGDSCTTVDQQFKIALVDLLRWNTALTSSCTTIGLGEAYCVAGGGDTCNEIYTVASGDSCGTIETKFTITLADIIAWNPYLTSSCAIQIGENLCVSGAPSTGTPTGPPSNIAAGTLENCTEYYTIASGDSCTSVDEKFDIALADLLRWNTALTSSCTTIGLGEAYCVAGGGDTCSKIYTVASGDSCGAIETKFNITLADIIAWNPYLTSSCVIQIGENLCVSGPPAMKTPTRPPSNIAAGTLQNCTEYYTVASGDSCTVIDKKFDIALADLLRWNTALTAPCTTIQLGEAYCVAGGGNACPAIYTVVSGDSCGVIETKFGITLNNLIAWNPFLTSTCAIQIGENLCVK
ncbi:hypothetical protein B0H16DRAFT_1438492 [Mycena metata]|uniref:LysM domain-containing protein n=1 Tax=Mycena metata TaxID=1033252 RepID=A0AAD7MAX3_9AGAR|nr:hypothetical protein B0H16DRAFT_1438492 [Mycena metata]